MKKLFFCAAALLAAISFSACSDNDETNLPATPASLAGTWQITHNEGWETYDGEKETYSEKYPDEDGFYWTLAFNKNGKCVSTEYENGKVVYTSDYTYTISGSTLTLKYSGYSDEDSYQIKKLTESQLVLFNSGKDEESAWENTETYKRIK